MAQAEYGATGLQRLQVLPGGDRLLQHTLPSRCLSLLAKHSLALQDEVLLDNLGKLPKLKDSLLRAHLMVSFSCCACQGGSRAQNSLLNAP